MWWRPQVVERVRKLPNTLIRRDADVRRLTDYQELELVVRRSAAAAGPFCRPLVY